MKSHLKALIWTFDYRSTLREYWNKNPSKGSQDAETDLTSEIFTSLHDTIKGPFLLKEPAPLSRYKESIVNGTKTSRNFQKTSILSPLSVVQFMTPCASAFRKVQRTILAVEVKCFGRHGDSTVSLRQITLKVNLSFFFIFLYLRFLPLHTIFFSHSLLLLTYNSMLQKYLAFYYHVHR